MTDIIRRRPLHQRGPRLRSCCSSLLSSFPIVPETKQAVVVRFGKPVRIINRYKPDEPIGGPGAGLAWRIPFAENIVWIDKRVLDVDMERQQVLSTDQLRLEVDAFARYRIVDPLRMYIRARDRGPGRATRCGRSSARSSATSSASGRSRRCCRPSAQGVMENVRRGLDRVARQYGAEIIDVRIKKADLPDGTPLQSAFDRMRTAREQEARSIRAEGAKRAQIIRAEADAEAAADLCRELRQGPGLLRFLPGDAVLPDDLPRRRQRASPRRRPSFCRRTTTI